MSYILTVKDGIFSCETDESLKHYKSESVHMYTRNVSEETCDEVLSQFKQNSLHQYLDSLTIPTYLILLWDVETSTLLIINDKFGSNEIFYAFRNDALCVSDDLPKLLRVTQIEHEIDMYSAYELLAFHTIRPPRTIYNSVCSLPMAHILIFESNALSITAKNYWDIDSRFKNKYKSYKELIGDIHNALSRTIISCTSMKIGVSLSGGIDSGGILGMLSKLGGRGIPSISLGGWGERTIDLESARKTANENGSRNIEIYPTLRDLRKLPHFMGDLNQPIVADFVLPNCLIYEQAHVMGLTHVAYGFGAEMLLGNLKISRAAYILRPIERIVPLLVRRLIYRVYAAYRGLSLNQIGFLMANTWSERFFLARGTLFTREAFMYKGLPADFRERAISEIGHIEETKNDLLDGIVKTYLYSWVNYMQYRDMLALGRSYGVKPIIPFDDPQVAELMMRIPTKFRRLNNWNKQIIRDLFAPYVSDRLKKGKVRSLIVPYSVLFAHNHESLIGYLRTSSLINKLIDLDKYEHAYFKLPEPGLSLMRLVGLAVWYDAVWSRENLKNFEIAVQKCLK